MFCKLNRPFSLLCCTAGLLTFLLAGIPTEAALPGGLSPVQIAQLKKLGRKILLPATLPPGFRVGKVTAEKVGGEGPGTGLRYVVEYINGQSQGFLVHGYEDCMGGNWAQTYLTIKHPKLGEIRIFPRELENHDFMYITSAVEDSGLCHELLSPGYAGNTPLFKRLSEADVKKIVQSLALVQL